MGRGSNTLGGAFTRHALGVFLKTFIPLLYDAIVRTIR